MKTFSKSWVVGLRGSLGLKGENGVAFTLLFPMEAPTDSFRDSGEERLVGEVVKEFLVIFGTDWNLLFSEALENLLSACGEGAVVEE
jgi:hypothetical protein